MRQKALRETEINLDWIFDKKTKLPLKFSTIIQKKQ